MTQLCMFGPQDRADQLAALYLRLAWECQQARGKLTENAYALMLGEWALSRQRLAIVTSSQLAIPAIAEFRERARRNRPSERATGHHSADAAKQQADYHPGRTFPPAHFTDNRPAWASRAPGGEP